MNINAVFENNTGYLKTFQWNITVAGAGMGVYYNETGSTTPTSSEDIGGAGKYANGKSYNTVKHITFTSAGYFYFDGYPYGATIGIYNQDTNTLIKSFSYSGSGYNKTKITSAMLCNLKIVVS
jgi:hypothetical protein